MGETAFANHPVVTGFANGLEAPVIAISKNLTARLLTHDMPFETVVTTVDYWFRCARL